MIEQIEEHLKATNTEFTIIDAYLTEYLLIRICTVCENELKNAVYERVNKNNDPELSNFVSNVRDVKLQNVHDLKGKILKRFSKQYSDAFDQKLKGTNAADDFKNLITNRNELVHGDRNNVQFSRLEATNVFSRVEFIYKTFSNILNSNSPTNITSK